MFTATGVSATKNPNGIITVVVQITNDALNGDHAFVAREGFTGPNLDHIVAQIKADLDRRRAEVETDTLTETVAGRVLATS